MGGPTGFAVMTTRVTTTTTTTTAALTARMHAMSLRDLHRGTATHGNSTPARNIPWFVDFLVRCRREMEQYSRPNVYFARTILYQEVLKLESSTSPHFDDVSGRKEFFNQNIMQYPFTDNILYEVSVFVEMLNRMMLAKDEDLSKLTGDSTNGVSLSDLLRGMYFDDPSNYYIFLYGMCLVNVKFFGKFGREGNEFMRALYAVFHTSLRTCITQRNKNVFSLERLHNNTRFLSNVRVRTLFSDARNHVSRVDICLAKLRLLCVTIPLDDDVTASNYPVQSVAEMCVKKDEFRRPRVDTNEINFFPIPVGAFMMAMNVFDDTLNCNPEDFRPTWSDLCGYLEKAGLVGPATLGSFRMGYNMKEYPITEQNPQYTYYFVLALLHAACEPYELNDETAATNMSAWFPPLLDSAFHAINYVLPNVFVERTQEDASQKKKEAWARSSGVIFEKTHPMRRRVVRALKLAKITQGGEEEENKYWWHTSIVAGFDGLMWEHSADEESDKRRRLDR